MRFLRGVSVYSSLLEHLYPWPGDLVLQRGRALLDAIKKKLGFATRWALRT